ncbi:MAG: GNAT family N-acetyltransferase [Pyrinomonadaceae bacterium]
MSEKKALQLTIRYADLSDARLISGLGATTFYETYFEQDEPGDLADYLAENFNPKQMEKELADPDSTFMIAEVEGKAVGYAKLRENSRVDCIRDEKAVELHRIYVLEKMSGRGIGGELIRECRAEARRKGFTSIWLGVWENNPKAQRFYRKQGFVKAGELRFRYGSKIETNYILRSDL